MKGFFIIDIDEADRLLARGVASRAVIAGAFCVGVLCGLAGCAMAVLS